MSAGGRYSDGVSDITLALHRIAAGDPQGTKCLLDLVYEELRRLASSKMAREAAGHTLQPTALVHEAWLRIGGDRQPHWHNRAHFFGAAAEAMRRILIDVARRKRAVRHGGNLARVDLNGADLELGLLVCDEQVLQVHEALERFAVENARKAELVKLRYFVGLSLEEAAEILNISERTAKRDWAYARAWLGDVIEQMRAS